MFKPNKIMQLSYLFLFLTNHLPFGMRPHIYIYIVGIIIMIIISKSCSSFFFFYEHPHLLCQCCCDLFISITHHLFQFRIRPTSSVSDNIYIRVMFPIHVHDLNLHDPFNILFIHVNHILHVLPYLVIVL